MAAAVLIAMPLSAGAGEVYDPANDVAAYQAYTRPAYGQPRPPQIGYFGSPGYVRRDELLARLNYAEAQYDGARQAGDRVAAKHWKRDIKHLRREIAAAERVRGSGYGAPGYVIPPQRPSYLPPAPGFRPPVYASPMTAYSQPYPSSMPPYGYAGAPPAPYPSGYANAPASPYGAPATMGTTGGLGTLLGPLLGGGPVASGAQYPQAVYPGAAAGATATTGSMGGLGSLLGPLLGRSFTP
jgi:hypothetical protein